MLNFVKYSSSGGIYILICQPIILELIPVLEINIISFSFWSILSGLVLVIKVKLLRFGFYLPTVNIQGAVLALKNTVLNVLNVSKNCHFPNHVLLLMTSCLLTTIKNYTAI